MADFVRSREATIYIDHHCCGDMFLQPYGWTEDLPASHEQMDLVRCRRSYGPLYGRNYRQGPILPQFIQLQALVLTTCMNPTSTCHSRLPPR